MSTVLSPAIEFAFTAGHVVATRRAAVPGFVGLVVMAVSGARFVDGPGGLVHPTASLSPRLANRDKRGNADGPGDSEERPQDRRGHEGRSVTQLPTKLMSQLLSSSPSRGHRVARRRQEHKCAPWEDGPTKRALAIDILPAMNDRIPTVPLTRHLGGFCLHRQPLGQVRL